MSKGAGVRTGWRLFVVDGATRGTTSLAIILSQQLYSPFSTKQLLVIVSVEDLKVFSKGVTHFQLICQGDHFECGVHAWQGAWGRGAVGAA